MAKNNLNWSEVEKLLKLAFEEDIGTGDVTTESIFPDDAACEALIKCKEDGILAGLPIAKAVFGKLGAIREWNEVKKDGDSISDGDILVRISGSQKQILSGERLALNILQRLSGIATLTSKYVNIVEGLDVKIVDTRKTVPGFRTLSKYAVKVGGGFNHRMGLYDGVLIKDNHIKQAGGIKNAVEKIKQKVGKEYKIEVETSNLNQVTVALEAGADIIMLDNMSDDMMKEAVKLIRKKALIEASGGINLERVRQIAEIGVDIISIGALTHSAMALDLSLDMV